MYAAHRTGALLRVLPEVYVDAALINKRSVGAAANPFTALPPELRRRAAMAYADGRAALSHLSALDVWGLRQQPADEPMHLSVPTGAGMRTRPHLTVHQRRAFVVQPPQVVVRRGIPVTRLELSLVDGWPLLSAGERRASVIRAVNDRLTTPQRVGTLLATMPNLPERAEFFVLLNRLDAGCHSPLEIWGHDHIFNCPGMPTFQRQVRVQVGGRTMYLDVYAEPERVNIELDGATTHGDPRQREIDIRRDALLATLGILVVRFAHRRLVHEPTEVRREILAILANRRTDG
ncbi:hypothetical protein GCM10027290_51370 [Micromonospora sonneratiae]